MEQEHTVYSPHTSFPPFFFFQFLNKAPDTLSHSPKPRVHSTQHTPLPLRKREASAVEPVAGVSLGSQKAVAPEIDTFFCG